MDHKCDMCGTNFTMPDKDVDTQIMEKMADRNFCFCNACAPIMVPAIQSEVHFRALDGTIRAS